MRINIEIDDELMAKAMRAGPYTSKRETVEAGLKRLARQAAYREILKWEGKLEWEGEPWVERDRRIPSTGEESRPASAVGKDECLPVPAVKPRKSVKRPHARR